MDTAEFIKSEKVDIFWKIYNHICYVTATDEWASIEDTSIDLMETLGFSITEDERKYLREYPEKYIESLDMKE